MKCYLFAFVILVATSTALANDPPRRILADPDGVDQFTTEGCELLYTFYGNMEGGQVLVGVQGGTDEDVVLLVSMSELLTVHVGVLPLPQDMLMSEFGLREGIRVVEGIVIGSFSTWFVEGMAIPSGTEGNAWEFYSFSLQVLEDLWVPQPYLPPAGGVATDDPPNYDNPRPAEFCPETFSCEEFTEEQCPPDTYDDCINNAQGGINGCLQRALCDLKECMRRACNDMRTCTCEGYKTLCDTYHENTGEWPPGWWAPAFPDLWCAGDNLQAGWCIVAWGIDVSACLPAWCRGFSPRGSVD